MPQILDFGGGFWILDFGDFGFWILGILDFGFWILDFGEFGFWILGPESQIQNPKSPKSKIQNPQNPQNPAKKAWILEFGDFGFWILDFGDFGFWIFGILGILDFGFWGFWILDFGDFGFCILDFGDFGFWIFGILGILDFGFLEHYVADLYVQSLDFGIWGFWILDFGDFGFWILGILDFGFWILGILDFGLGILDGHLVTKFWMLHKKRSCARRPGSADLHLESTLVLCCGSQFLQVEWDFFPFPSDSLLPRLGCMRLRCEAFSCHQLSNFGTLNDCSANLSFFLYGCFLKWWVSPSTMGFPTKNDHDLGCEMGVPPLRKHPYVFVVLRAL